MIPLNKALAFGVSMVLKLIDIENMVCPKACTELKKQPHLWLHSQGVWIGRLPHVLKVGRRLQVQCQ